MTTARHIQALIDCTPLAQIEHPQYIEGTLYITRRQLEAIEATSPGLPTTMTSYIALGSIPETPAYQSSYLAATWSSTYRSWAPYASSTPRPHRYSRSAPPPTPRRPGPMADADVSRVRDAIWNELERQAARFGHVDRDQSVIDMTAIELDMDQVAVAAIKAAVGDI